MQEAAAAVSVLLGGQPAGTAATRTESPHPGRCVAMLAHMSDEELRQAYNANLRPNTYGDELLRRILERDQRELGMSADNPRLRADGERGAP